MKTESKKPIYLWCKKHNQLHLAKSITKVFSSYIGKEGTTYTVERKNLQGKMVEVILNLYNDGTYYAETIWVPDLSKEPIVRARYGKQS